MSQSRQPPKTREQSIMTMLRNLSERPAMNGGFLKLAEQQDEQLTRLASLEARLQPVEEWVGSIMRWGKWVLGGIGAIFITVLGELLVNVITHLHISLN